MPAASPLRVVAVNGSPSHPSRSRAVAEAVLEAVVERAGELGVAVETEVIDLASLDPAALLALTSDAAVDAARDRVAASSVLVIATPVYRATYTALTKTIFDLLPQGALAGTVAVPVATGYGSDHHLCVDHALRPLVASLDGLTVPTGIYATKADVSDGGELSEKLRTRVAAAAREALVVARALDAPPEA